MNNRLFLATAVLCCTSITASASIIADPNSGLPDATLPVNSGKASKAAKVAEVKTTKSYTVHKGDTLGYLGHKFDTTVTELKSLNHLTKNKLHAGMVLQVPGKLDLKAAALAKIKAHARRAQPVQDFDIPASNFASCPVPVPSEADAVPPSMSPPLTEPKPLVAPVKPMAHATTSAPTPAVATDFAHHIGKNAAPMPPPAENRFTSAAPAPAPAPARHGFFNFFYTPPPVASDWGTKFTQLARQLGDQGICYDEGWRPPGEPRSWAMDCSNTTRYLYKAATGIQLPRTASDQYYYLHLQNKAWDAPQLASGYADCNYLRTHLKAGDLLFWENTYRPERQPPITHVMIFLGANTRGEWIMAGSQSSRGGEHNRRRGGPDIYVFNPERPCGGYTTWLGLVHHQGRFCAFGRPLEADKSKLAVAAND